MLLKNLGIKLVKIILMAASLAAVLFSASAFAGTVTLTTIANQLGGSVTQLAVVLSNISLIAGIGFIMASFFKFHQHKLNPTQVPLSQGITLLLIGAGLTLFPTLIPTASTALFGENTEMAKVGGSQIRNLIGGTAGGTG